MEKSWLASVVPQLLFIPCTFCAPSKLLNLNVIIMNGFEVKQVRKQMCWKNTPKLENVSNHCSRNSLWHNTPTLPRPRHLPGEHQKLLSLASDGSIPCTKGYWCFQGVEVGFPREYRVSVGYICEQCCDLRQPVVCVVWLSTIDYGVTDTLHLNKLEREENLASVFSYFNKDGSGCRTIDELQQACKELGLSDLHLEKMIKEIDHDYTMENSL